MKNDIIKYRREKNTSAISFLSTLISDIELIGINSKKEITDRDSIDVIKKYIKNINECLYYSQTDELKNQLKILENYLPKQLTETELETIITTIIVENKNPNIGMIMKTLSSKYTGLFDGKIASGIASYHLKKLSFSGEKNTEECK
jgi:hypothetical protein